MEVDNPAGNAAAGSSTANGTGGQSSAAGSTTDPSVTVVQTSTTSVQQSDAMEIDGQEKGAGEGTSVLEKTTEVTITSNSQPADARPTAADGSGAVVSETNGSTTDAVTSAAGPSNSLAASTSGPFQTSQAAAAPVPAQLPSLIDVDQSRPSSSRSTPLALARRPPSPQRMVRTGYIYDPLMMLHCPDDYTPTSADVQDSANGHPEEPMRIQRIFTRLAESGVIKRMKKLEFNQVSYDQIRLVHSEEHWEKVQGTETLTDQYIQESKPYYDRISLYVCRETAHCARLSCGGVIQACMSVCKGEVRNAFAIVRPPGHHAEPEEHMGFCFYNNVAVAAREVMTKGLAKKVLILDWDVHHGNGTQRAFWNDPDVLYISIHRHDGGKFYPTSDFGAMDMVGEGEGVGRNVNIPWPSAGFGDGDYIYAFQKIVMPIAYEFAPDLVIISAGFDAAEGDTLGGCNVSPAAYGHMTHMLCALAGGKVVVALEGGYNLDAISRSSLAVAHVLLGETPSELPALEASEVGTEVIHQVAKIQSKYWKSIDPKACEPPEGTGENTLPTISIPDLLKIHRAYHMFEKHKLFQIPLASEELEEAFGGQVICNEGVYEAGKKSVLVVFVHDFGNLRVETDGVGTTNVNLTNSYLLDTSDQIVDWVTKSGYNLIDVNILAQLPTRFTKAQTKMITAGGPKAAGQLMRYIWDNYIELSEAENIVLIGHGSGCKSVMDLINHRDVVRKVKAVIQVAGMHSMVRIDPDNETRREWFKKSNQVYLPTAHPILQDERAKRRIGGQIFTSDQAKVVDVLVDVLPRITSFVTSKVEPEAVGGANGIAGGSLVNGTNGTSLSNGDETGNLANRVSVEA